MSLFSLFNQDANEQGHYDKWNIYIYTCLNIYIYVTLHI